VCHFPPPAFFGVGCVLRLEAEATRFAENLASPSALAIWAVDISWSASLAILRISAADHF
jgi:hypothetical protein